MLTITSNHLIAHKAKIAEELMIMNLAISESFLFVMAMPEKWLLALGAHKVLHMPLFTQSGNNALLNRTSTCATDWYSHLIMTT